MLAVAEEVTPTPAQQVIVKRSFPCRETQWQPGTSGNPKGRPAAGAAVVEWFNVLSDTPEAELRKILRDKAAPNPKKAAARCWIHATSLKTNSSGNPIAGSEVDRILDRTIGKAIQRAEVLAIDATAFDLSRLAPDRLALLASILDEARREPGILPPSETVVTTVDK